MTFVRPYQNLIINSFTIEKLLFLTAFVFCFMPFFSPFPIATDLQPAMFAPIIFLFFFKRMRGISNYEMFFIFIGLWSVIFVNINEPYFTFRKSLSILLAFFIYHFFRKYTHFLTSRFIFIIALINLVALVFHFFLPSIFTQTLGLFVRTIKIVSMEGPRGASGFAAEPGFMAALAVFYMVASLMLKEFKGDGRFFPLTAVTCLIMILLTKSGAGALLIILFCGAYFFRFNLKYLILGFFAFIILYLFVTYADFGRAGYVARSIFNDPLRLLLTDASVGHRVINIVVGFLAVFEFPFGSGAGSYEKVSQIIISKYKIFDYVSGKSSNVSAFAKYSVELGLIFWFFLILTVLKAVSRSGAGALKYILVSMFFISATFSVIFPPVWFIFACLHKKNKRHI